MRAFYLIFICSLLPIYSCKESNLPKPYGQLRLEYPKSNYAKFKASNCPYRFEISEYAEAQKKDSFCWYNIYYKKMRANIHLTYLSGKEDLDKKIKNSERLAHEHSVKASYIAPQVFENKEKNVFGTLFEIGGETAINYQFHLTDSLNHLLSGSVYFSTPPNYDSLKPAINYVKKDVIHLIESLEWID